jgi:hypothetical protein
VNGCRACGKANEGNSRTDRRRGLRRLMGVASMLDSKSTRLLADQDQIRTFVDAIFRNAKMEGFVSLRAFYQDGDNKSFRITSLEIGISDDPRSAKKELDQGRADVLAIVATREANHAAQEPRPVNFCPPLAVFNNRKQAREEDIIQGLVISVEADSRPMAAWERLEKILGPATVVVESGGIWKDPETNETEPKLHLHWRLTRPATDKDALAKLKQARTLAATIVGGDPTNNPVNHPIRWPGGWHRKNNPPRLARIMASNECEIDLDTALARLIEAAPEIDRQPHYSGVAQSDPKLVAIAIKYIPNDWEDDGESWDGWNRIGMAIYRATDGNEEGRIIFHTYSAKSKQDRYNAENTDKKWESYHRSPPTKIGAGTLFHLAYEVNRNWRDEYDRAVEARPPHASEPAPEYLRQYKGPTGKSHDPRHHHAYKVAGNDQSPRDDSPQSDAKTAAADSKPKDDRSKSKAEAKPEAEQFDLAFDPWAKFVVPQFRLDVLPEVLKNFVVERSAVIGCDPSGLSMAVLTACSGAIDHRFQLKMMKHGGWYVAPRLWTLLVGDSSDKKTQMMNEAIGPLEKYQAELWRAHKIAKEEYKAQSKKDGAEKTEEPEPPPRYVTWDTTIEKLGEFFARSPKGLLVKRDEIAGWVGSMERYARGSRSGAADRAFWLKTHDGGPYAMDRIARGETYIENLSASLIGGIQPRRFAELQGLTSDGLLQRFLPVILRPGEFTLDRPTDDRDYENCIRALIGMSPCTLMLTDQAIVALESLRKHLHELERASAGLAIGFGSFIGKLPEAAGALTIILHSIENKFNVVDESTIEKVRRIVVNFLIPHAMEFYRTSEATTDGDRLQQLASYILTSGNKRFVASDFTSNVASMRGLGLKEVNERVSPLVAAGWLCPEDYRAPILHAWVLGKDVAAQFAERKKLEEERKAAIARLMGSPRKSG